MCTRYTATGFEVGLMGFELDFSVVGDTTITKCLF